MTNSLILSDEERRLIKAYRKLKSEHDFQPKEVLTEVPELQNVLLQEWNGMSQISDHSNALNAIYLWHQLCYWTIFGVPTLYKYERDAAYLEEE